MILEVERLFFPTFTIGKRMDNIYFLWSLKKMAFDVQWRHKHPHFKAMNNKQTCWQNGSDGISNDSSNHCCPGLSALANRHQNNWKLKFPCQHSQTPWLSGRSHVCFYGSSHPASWQSMMVLEKNLKLKNAQPLSTQRKVRRYPGFFPFNIFPGYFRHCH